MVFNLIGGAWTDRVGGMNIFPDRVRGTAAAGIMFAASSSFAGLFATAQIMMIVARAVYWPASWSSSASFRPTRQLDGDAEPITSFGQIAGTVGAGMIIAGWASARVFGPLPRWGRLLCLGPRVPLHAPGPGEGYAPGACGLPDAARPALDLLRHHVRLISALPFSLSVSFYPILLIEQGFGFGSGRLARRNACPGRDCGGRRARAFRETRGRLFRTARIGPGRRSLGGPRRPFHEPVIIGFSSSAWDSARG